MSGAVQIDLSDFRAFFARLKKAAGGDFQKELVLFLEGMGFEFLRLVQDEIIRRKVVDTRLLLNSFHKDGDGNVWELSDGGLTLEIGSGVEYATFVNDGHWTNKQGQARRFVPGRWDGGRFIYEPGAKTGMVLKQRWVEGAHYWESAMRILQKMYPDLLEAMLQKWLDQYFSDFI
jgi:hypothetical protein